MVRPYLEQLEAESIYIIREAIAETQQPVMLYSIGKDSSVLLHLAIKAFYPAPLPFPVLHIDTGWKFKDMLFLLLININFQCSMPILPPPF